MALNVSCVPYSLDVSARRRCAPRAPLRLFRENPFSFVSHSETPFSLARRKFLHRQTSFHGRKSCQLRAASPPSPREGTIRSSPPGAMAASEGGESVAPRIAGKGFSIPWGKRRHKSGEEGGRAEEDSWLAVVSTSDQAGGSFISQKEFIKSFCKSQFPHESFKLFFIFTHIEIS